LADEHSANYYVKSNSYEEVTVGELTLTDGDPDQIDQPETSESNAVVLRRITSGKTLIDLVCGSFSGKLYCAAEPTEENINALTDMVERIEFAAGRAGGRSIAPTRPSAGRSSRIRRLRCAPSARGNRARAVAPHSARRGSRRQNVKANGA
jgi:hypothetical protein